MPPSAPSPQDTVAPPLAERLASRLAALPETEGLEHVLAAIAQGVRALERPTRQAALADVLGATGEINVQGEAVQRLDALGTETFVAALRDCGLVAALACEELEGSIHLSDAPDHPYLVLFDPVDGSSNIDVAMTIGSIFGIYRRASPEPLSDETLLLRPGAEQVAAGYTLYGSSTMFVIASAGRRRRLHIGPRERQHLPAHARRPSASQRSARTTALTSTTPIAGRRAYSGR